MLSAVNVSSRRFETCGRLENYEINNLLSQNHEELKNAFDLCLSCKACASECPSNVDVATLKAVFLYNYQEANGYSLRSKLFAYNTQLNALGSKVAGITNWMYESKTLGDMLKKAVGVAPERNLPKVGRFNFKNHLKNN